MLAKIRILGTTTEYILRSGIYNGSREGWMEKREDEDLGRRFNGGKVMLQAEELMEGR
mgnify:CR=1 FL=1